MSKKHKDSIVAIGICTAFLFGFCAVMIEARGGSVDYLSTGAAIAIFSTLAVLATRIKEK
jgi:hypothetical protein